MAKKKSKQPWAGRTEKQIKASKKNFARWNRLRKMYGNQGAKKIVEMQKSENLKSNMTGAGAHDLYGKIMDTVSKDDREAMRGFTSDDVLEVGLQWMAINASDEEPQEGAYMDIDDIEELMIEWSKPF